MLLRHNLHVINCNYGIYNAPPNIRPTMVLYKVKKLSPTEQMCLKFLSGWCCPWQHLEYRQQPIPSLRRSNREKSSVANTSTCPWSWSRRESAMWRSQAKRNKKAVLS